VRKEKRFVKQKVNKSNKDSAGKNKNRSNRTDTNCMISCCPLDLPHFMDSFGDVFFNRVHKEYKIFLGHFPKKKQRMQEKSTNSFSLFAKAYP